MKVMVLVKATKSSEAGQIPSRQLLEDMMNYNAELVKAGIMTGGDGLQPSSKGVRVHFSGTNRTVIDGPFAETKELVAGYWLWQVKSMEEAIAWAKRCPNPMPEDSDLEIRPMFEMEDFGDSATPELRQQEAQLRTDIANSGLEPPRFENGPERLIAGYNANYTFESRVNIPTQWLRFAPHIGKVPTQVGQDSYGVCWNYKPGYGFDYLSGVEVRDTTKLPADFTHVRLAAGKYAVFTHHKHVSSIAETLDAIWRKWLPNSGTPSFELYTETFDPKTGMGGFEIWIPLKA